MIPIHLHLAGFLSYQDPVDLDFTTFELACISGSNGAGKSSLLDAITWALFGQARRRDDALINSHAPGAEVIFDFFYESNTYRVLRSKPREKTTVLEFFVRQAAGPNGESAVWRPLTEKSMRDTEARIQSTLRMDYDTFTNASFLLQGRADQFAQQRPGDRKKVLSTILGLEVWEQYRADAAESRRAAEMELRSVDAQVAEIDAELNMETARRQKLAEIETRLEQASKLRQAHEGGLDALRRLTAALEEQRRVVDLLERTVHESRQRRERLRADLEALYTERAGYRQSLEREAEVRAAYRRWTELRADLERWDGVAANFREIEARRAGPLTRIAAEASRLDQERRSLSAQEQAVRQEQERLPGIDQQLAEVGAVMERLQGELAGREAWETGLREVQAQASDAKAENGALKESMRALKERITRLSQVDGAVCPLCGQPLSPGDRAALVLSLEGEGKEMGDRYRANLEMQSGAEQRVRALQAQIAGLARCDDDLRLQARLHDRLEAERQRIMTAAEQWQAGGAERLAEVNRSLTAQDFACEARAELAEIDDQSRALGYDAAAHDALRRDELQARAAEDALRALESASASLAPLERQISGLEAQVAQEESRLLEQERSYNTAFEKYQSENSGLPDVNEVEREVYALQTEENRLRMEMGMARQAVAVLGSQRDRRARLSTLRDGLNLQVARLKTLERAFSKDGVPALLIEQALPEIEVHANELLDRLSGGSMSVRFETQRLYKDKARDDRRETLDIIISDASGPREYELFSGGEAFRVNFAIRLALSRVLAQRAGARLQMLVVDEGFGSQDAEGRQRLIEAINLVRQDFKKIIVITHLEELKEAFPARIEVEKTLRGSRLQVVA